MKSIKKVNLIGIMVNQINKKILNMSDRSIAWLFTLPTLILLIFINIYPLIWSIYLSFTNFKANRPGVPIEWVGTKWYKKILLSEDVWANMQVTAHFLLWTIVLQALLGLSLALLLNRKFKGHELMTTVVVLPMMLSPAVVGVFWTYIYQPQTGIFNYIVNFFKDFGEFTMIGDFILAPWSIVIVDTWMWTPFVMLMCLAGLRSIPDYLYEAAEVDRASKWQQFIHITLPSVLPFLMLAVLFRGIENFKMFDMVNELTGGGPGSITELASIHLKRAAFEKWRTGYSSAFAVILFVTIFGAGNIYVKFLNKLKEK
ncbi:MAG: sugar ABC transporter permease [Desulfobacula sp.]|uniref:carbohydrate ABC transporter permease n=1 Tax=Desulfobacula sp. TaxID=2593537 RepID=UPI0025BC00CD|nr:sugar ABC transporter permease [Desulfobacula sp.]MCD4719700.1 sugar ABC transporter permease [Desulfobacula sp.]